MKRVFITRPLHPVAKETLRPYFQVDENPKDEVLPRDKLKEVVRDYDAILSTIPDILDKEILSHAKNLKLISNFAIGLDNIDVQYAHSKGIQVYNLPDVVTNSTADLTFALLLALIRKIPEAWAYVKEDRWKMFEPSLFLGEELAGKTFGIFGFGRIGKAVARRALGFGLKVIVYHRSQVALEDPFKGQVEQVSIDELFRRVDYLSLHVPLTDETRNRIRMDEMCKMVRHPILINMARGPIVNTHDLVIALEKGILRGAALDVTDPEPISGSHPLCKRDNCLIIPHLGTATIECRYQMAKQAASNIIEPLA